MLFLLQELQVYVEERKNGLADKLIKEVTDVPAAVGFGINTPEQAENISKIADGVIVGSAIVKIIAEHGENAKDPIVKYVKSMKTAVLKGQL